MARMTWWVEHIGWRGEWELVTVMAGVSLLWPWNLGERPAQAGGSGEVPGVSE